MVHARFTPRRRILPSSRRGSGAFYAPQDALKPRAEDRQRVLAFLHGRVWFANALGGFRGQSGYLLASYCHAPVLKRLSGSYFSLRARRRLMVSCGNTPSISASLSGIALFKYVVT
jgi:hypothetical protein